METPSPVTMTPQMIAILAKSRQVMNKIETEKPTTPTNVQAPISEAFNGSSFNEPIYNESDEREPIYEQPLVNSDPTRIYDYTEEQVMASKLPQNVKEAMIKNKIPKMSVTALSQEAIDLINPKAKPQSRPKPLTETIQRANNSDLITISRSELKEIMNETLVSFLKTNYEKTLTESAITKTINLLIKEGKINVKKKTI